MRLRTRHMPVRLLVLWMLLLAPLSTLQPASATAFDLSGHAVSTTASRPATPRGRQLYAAQPAQHRGRPVPACSHACRDIRAVTLAAPYGRLPLAFEIN